METAKVDLRRLQLLNDRINQTIDALNQVRMSVHGMTSGGMPDPRFFMAQPWGLGVPGFPANTVVDPRLQAVPFFAGSTTPWTQGVVPMMASGLFHSNILDPRLQVMGPMQAGYNPFFGAGLTHTAYDPRLQQLAYQQLVSQQLINPLQQAYVSPVATGLWHSPFVDPRVALSPFAGITPVSPFQQVVGSPFVPGLSHTGIDPRVQQQLNPYATIGAFSPYQQQVLSPWMTPGLSHTSIDPRMQQLSPYAALSPFSPYQQLQSPWMTPGLSHSTLDPRLQVISPYQSMINPLTTGLSHTAAEIDPLGAWRITRDPWQARISQTFPYAQLPYAPVMGLAV